MLLSLLMTLLLLCYCYEDALGVVVVVVVDVFSVIDEDAAVVVDDVDADAAKVAVFSCYLSRSFSFTFLDDRRIGTDLTFCKRFDFIWLA